MSPLLRRLLIGLGLVLAVVSVLTWRFLAAAGYFTGIKQEVAAQCATIPSPPGPEDIQIDRAANQGAIRRIAAVEAPGIHILTIRLRYRLVTVPISSPCASTCPCIAFSS